MLPALSPCCDKRYTMSVFSEFIQGVSQFSVKGDKLSKLRFAFRIYDMDKDGLISNGELFQVREKGVCGAVHGNCGERCGHCPV